MAKALFFVAEKGFRDPELFKPKDVLENNGVECHVTSTGDQAEGAEGAIVMCDVSLDKVNVDDYDAFILIGGPGTMSMNIPPIVQIFKEAESKGKLIAAICWAPAILAKNGFLEGKKATVWSGAVDDLKHNDANYIEEGVVEDGIITACGPQVANEFGEKILSHFL